MRKNLVQTLKCQCVKHLTISVLFPGPSRADHRPGAPLRYRRLGARLLPPVQERTPRLRARHLRGRQLEGRRREARQGQALNERKGGCGPFPDLGADYF